MGSAIVAWIIAVATAVSLAGCASNRPVGLKAYNTPPESYVESNAVAAERTPSPPQSSEPPQPQELQPTNADAARAAAASELGPEAAASIPDSEPHQPVRSAADPGARRLVDDMLAALPDSPKADAGGTTNIGTSQVRNQSRCAKAEYETFQSRFAGLLNDAADTGRVHFTAESAADVQYQMQGAAYLVTAEGFDMWELFLSLSPADRPYTIWKCEGPVRVLRTPRPGAPQVFGP